MDDNHFDRLAATFASGPSRRRLLGTLLGTALASLSEQLETATGKKKNKNKKCSFGRPRCGNKCCVLDETCVKGKCKHHCEDGKKNLGETDVDCGSVCDGVLGTSPGGRCKNRKRCEVAQDCRSAFCEEISPGAGKVCVDCNIDSDCDILAGGRRCLDHFCFECAADFDCPGQVNPPEERFCITIPVTAGSNNEPCPNNLPCVCRECRQDSHCPAERPHCQTGTGTPFDGQCFECLEDTDCPQGQLCDEQGACEGFECDDNEDCPTGVACVNNACTGTCEPPGPCANCANNPNVSCCNSLCGGVTCCDFGQVCNQQNKTCS